MLVAGLAAMQIAVLVVGRPTSVVVQTPVVRYQSGAVAAGPRRVTVRCGTALGILTGRRSTAPQLRDPGRLFDAASFNNALARSVDHGCNRRARTSAWRTAALAFAGAGLVAAGVATLPARRVGERVAHAEQRRDDGIPHDTRPPS